MIRPVRSFSRNTPVALDPVFGALDPEAIHPFHPCRVSGVARLGEHADPDRLTGHRQNTDAHLVALAREYDGGLVTFDRGVVGLAEGARVHLLTP